MNNSKLNTVANIGRAVSVAFVSGLLFAYSAVAGAEELIKPGCGYKTLPPGLYGGKPFQSPPEQFSEDGHWQGDITVKMANHDIAGCETELRSYNGQLVGTTIRVKPGDTININLKNMLPVDDTPTPGEIKHCPLYPTDAADQPPTRVPGWRPTL